jgi:hypothetical protein
MDYVVHNIPQAARRVLGTLSAVVYLNDGFFN